MGLTPQERAILEGYAAGLTAEQVAAACGLSLSTVRAHLVTIQQKLDAPSKLEAILVALKDGLISWPSPSGAPELEAPPPQPPDDCNGYQLIGLVY